MATVTKGSNKKARRQPGMASKNIRKNAPSDAAPRDGAGGGSAHTDISSNMDGHGNMPLSGNANDRGA